MKRKAIAGLVALAVLVAGGMIFLVYRETGGFRYRSSYVTTMCVTSSDSDSASISFSTMKGTRVFRLKYDGHAGGCIGYNGKLDAGKITVYYDNDGTKKELFTLEAGGTVNASGGELTEKGPVFIIIETDGKCEEGKLEFSLQ